MIEAPALGGDGQKPFQFTRKLEVNVLVVFIKRGNHAGCEWHKITLNDF